MDDTSDDDACAKPLSCKKFLDLLDKMNWTDKYPQKLSLRDAMTIRQETLGTVHSTDQLAVLPYLVLQKMMMCDQRCRSCLYKVSTSTTKSKPTRSDSDSESSDSDSDDVDDNSLHPVDCMLTVLHCCDDILRQDLISKLSLCQLAIPFLLPNPTDNTVTFLLWAMRSLFRGWKCHKTGGKERRIVDYQGPIVSFLRIGNSPSSKSEILNAVIGGESKFFFNRRECEGGDCERNFVDGLVEMCCYLPSGKDTDPFTDAVIFLNLRGDAQQHLKQVEFLQKISCISVVLTVETSIDENSVKVLQTLSEAPGGIILLLAEDKQQKKGSRSKNLDLIRQVLPKNKTSKMKLRNKNMATLSSELQQLLAEKLTNAAPEHFTAISNCYQAAKDASIKTDEDIKDSVNGKQYAKTIMEKVHSVRFNEVKYKMLPLQGPSLWHKWAKSDKERHRHVDRKQETNVTEYNAQIDKHKMEIRREQINRCVTLTPVMDCFMESLLKTTANVRKYYLQWLKLFLDDHSRKILPELHNNYQETRDDLIALKEKCQSEENSQIRELKEKLKIQNEELINASFGLEHLFREMGQIYEARMDSGGYEVPQTLKDKANSLPQIMAEIMDEGHALELMDGDASHVPTLWVLAVIEKLKAVCGKNAREKNGGKIFVLSVLGIQSTGKSTLLNTMFGLRFSVSAGRCTRGAYIQLLPLNNSLRQMIDCDYVLIVDTEGLRAPELQLEGLKHDNELATFVIGLADATIINIFGETPGDLDDILQTSLHAFIRMRKVEMNPSCLFVHQNVPDVLASSKSKLGRQKFHSKLDTMTQAAAKVENCEGQYNSFNQVIDFDDCKDVFYFPSLWKGDPPMAPVNIGYSESAQTLKTALKELTQRKQTCRCSLEIFKLRVQNLWSAVIQENFVFSFKNTLEVSAYNELNQECAQWSRILQSKMLEWENTTKDGIRGKTKEQIKKVKEACLQEAEKILTKTNEEITEKMELFLNSSDHSETLSQWRNKTEKRIKELTEEKKKQASNYCDDLEMSKVYFIEADKLVEDNFTEVDEKIKELVSESWGEDIHYSDDKLKQKFDDTWKEWMKKFKAKVERVMISYPTAYVIETEIVQILRELLQSNDAMIIQKLSKKPFNERSSSLTLDDLNTEIHQYLSSTKWFGFKSIGNSEVQLATEHIQNHLAKARKYLDEVRAKIKPFNPSFVYVALQDLLTSVDDLTKPEKKSNFVFTPDYKIDMAILVCVYASDVFKETTQIIKQDNDPVLIFNKKKDMYLNNFILRYRRENDDKLAAIKIRDLLNNSIRDTVIANIPTKIRNALERNRPYLERKRGFKIQILKDLADRGNSESYRTFLYDIARCFRDWIDRYIDDCCSYSPSSITSPAQSELTSITDSVVRTINQVCNAKSTNIDSWISMFTNKLRSILPCINEAEIKVCVKECDITAFVNYLKGELQTIKYNHQLINEFNNARSIISALNCRANPPRYLLYDNLIGCSATCPFCKEQCDVRSTNGTHSGKHSVSFHRPECLGGYSYVNSQKLCLNICTKSSPDETFQCSETGWQPVKYLYYSNYFGSWDIPLNSLIHRDEPKYWQWFICRYRSYVLKWAAANDADIPSDWYDISQPQAINSLEHIY